MHYHSFLLCNFLRFFNIYDELLKGIRDHVELMFTEYKQKRVLSNTKQRIDFFQLTRTFLLRPGNTLHWH